MQGACSSALRLILMTKATRTQEQWTYWLLLGILLMAAGLRLWQISAPSLSVAEGAQLAQVAAGDGTLYSRLLAVWTTWAGTTELALRLPSAWAGMLALALAARLARTVALMLSLSHKQHPAQTHVPVYVAGWLALAQLSLSASRTAQASALDFLLSMVLLWSILHFVAIRPPALRTRLLSIGGVASALVLALYSPVAVAWLEALWQGRLALLTGQWGIIGGLALVGMAAYFNMAMARLSVLASLGIACLAASVLMMPDSTASLLILSLPLALLISQGLSQFSGIAGRSLLIVIPLYALFNYATPMPSPDWRTLAHTISQALLSDDELVIGVSQPAEVLHYYLASDIPTHNPSADDDRAMWLIHPLDQAPPTPTGYQASARQTDATLNIAWTRYEPQTDRPLRAQFANGIQLGEIHTSPDGRLGILWRADVTPSADYTRSYALLDAEGRLIAQSDQLLSDLEGRLTSAWGQAWVYDMARLTTPEGAPVPAGSYTLIVKLYQWTPDGIRDVALATGEAYYVYGTLTITTA